MKMAEVKEKARKMGIAAAKADKVELIRSIQQQEGNFPCFGTADGSCDQVSCSWRDDCVGKGRVRAS